jgi:hypothetical protein
MMHLDVYIIVHAGTFPKQRPDHAMHHLPVAKQMSR